MPATTFKTFSPAFDKILGGGLPRSSIILFEVSPVTYGWHHAASLLFDGLKKGEFGVYITFDHSPRLIRHILSNYGLDVKGFEESRRFFIINGFRWGEKEGTYFIRDPSNYAEVVNVFTSIKDNAAGDVTNCCRCVVDSTVSLFFGHGASKMVSFALLLREVSVQTGIASVILSPVAIGRRINDILGFNSDVIVEFRGFDEGEKLVNKVRLRKMSGQEPSAWVPFTLSGNKILFKGE
jgi:KaiC/GvpD/RAD55 family RecA-like ATPase